MKTEGQPNERGTAKRETRSGKERAPKTSTAASVSRDGICRKDSGRAFLVF